MNYQRVIPRDFFNEAKLLKCMGQLALKILDCKLPNGIKISIDECGEPFEVGMNEDGDLSVMNYETTVNREYVTFCTLYNSTNNYPLYCRYEDEAYLVFNEKGEFSNEFISRFSDPF